MDVKKIQTTFGTWYPELGTGTCLYCGNVPGNVHYYDCPYLPQIETNIEGGGIGIIEKMPL